MCVVGAVQAWHEIMRWLSDHAPSTAAVLVQGADKDDVRALEREIGVVLPADLTEWWSVCGGTARLEFAEVIPPFYTPLGPADSLDAWRCSRKVWLDRWERPNCGADAGSRAFSFHPSWVPIAFDGCGDHLVLDLRPGEFEGCVLEWDHEQCVVLRPEWPGLVRMLDEVAESLRTGRPVGHSHPDVTADGRIDWRIA